MSLANFQYGIGAVVLPDQRETFNEFRNDLIANARPGTFAEQLIVDQLLHAQWELHRVRLHANQIDAEVSLHAAFTRATRNWQRATRHLAALQSARASASLCRQTTDAEAPPPLANFAKVPRRKQSTASFREWRTDMFELGYDGPIFFDPFYDDLNQQEKEAA